MAHLESGEVGLSTLGPVGTLVSPGGGCEVEVGLGDGRSAGSEGEESSVESSVLSRAQRTEGASERRAKKKNENDEI
jgi:hypothetical protein